LVHVPGEQFTQVAANDAPRVVDEVPARQFVHAPDDDRPAVIE
jgi:hypothetical protein